MTFIRNAWYCVGYPEEIGIGATKSLTVLGDPLLLFRGADGALRALADRCPHRFAPLSMGGKIIGNEVQCPYHGLRFDGSGQCTHNPHGDHVIPKAAKVRRYPVLQRHGVIWAWMGDSEKADPAALPDFRDIEERPGFARVHSYLKTPAHYALVIDNLLDLTHVRYLHPFLAGIEGQRQEPERVNVGMEQHGETIVAITETFAESRSPLVDLLWNRGAPPERVDTWGSMRWDAPGALLLDSGIVRCGAARSEGLAFPSAHLLTPETETTTHYFFILTRNSHLDRSEIGDQMIAAAQGTFGSEDSPMIHACQRNMGTTDLLSLNPVLLNTDASAIRARRLISARLEAEARAA